MSKPQQDEHYKKTLYELQVELVKLQRDLIAGNARVLILLEGRDAAGKDGLDRNRFSQGAGEQICHAGNEPVRIDGFGLERLASRKGEELARQRSGARCSFVCGVEKPVEIARHVGRQIPAGASSPECAFRRKPLPRTDRPRSERPLKW